MSLKTKIVVLRRIRAGDQDLLAKVYGQGGVLDLFVKDGYLNTNRFFGIFEPFNVAVVDLVQKGGVVVPNDVNGLRRFSLLSRDYRRFRWMSWIAKFILSYVGFYDEKLFDLFLNYMLADTEGAEHLYRVRFKLDYLIKSGLKPKFLKESFGRGKLKVRLSDGSVRKEGEIEVESFILRLMVKLAGSRKLKTLNIDEGKARKMEGLLDALIEYHTK